MRFVLYGTDWLAFAHPVIAVAFYLESLEREPEPEPVAAV